MPCMPGLKTLLYLFLLAGGMTTVAAAQVQNKYGLQIISQPAILEKMIQEDSNRALVNLKKFIPGIVLDIKYASKQNVFYEKLYPRPSALVRLPVARALAAVQTELRKSGWGLKIYDAYRPYAITCRMWDRMPDSIYMGKPWRGSKHNRGIALDLTLIDWQTQKELPMPTPYDALVYPSHPDFQQLSAEVIRNRDTLIHVMKKHGFTVARNEWWHFDYLAGNHFEILDIPHRDLMRMTRKMKFR